MPGKKVGVEKGTGRGKRTGSNPLLPVGSEQRAEELKEREKEICRPLMLGEKGLNPRQELLVHEYLKDMDAPAAYMRAGYDCKDQKSAYVGSHLQLKNPLIQQEIYRIQSQRISRIDIDGDWTVIAFKYLFLQATECNDWSAACRALENIGKYLGIYEKDNRQRTYVESDLERLKSELAQAGFDMARTNYNPPPPSSN